MNSSSVCQSIPVSTFLSLLHRFEFVCVFSQQCTSVSQLHKLKFMWSALPHFGYFSILLHLQHIITSVKILQTIFDGLKFRPSKMARLLLSLVQSVTTYHLVAILKFCRKLVTGTLFVALSWLYVSGFLSTLINPCGISCELAQLHWPHWHRIRQKPFSPNTDLKRL